jgi:hypothetical protein
MTEIFFHGTDPAGQPRRVILYLNLNQGAIMKTKQILRPSEVEHKLETRLLYTYTTLAQLRKDIKSALKLVGKVTELNPDVVPQICDAYEIDFELDVGNGTDYYSIQVYYTKCRTNKIFIVEIDVGT